MLLAGVVPQQEARPCSELRYGANMESETWVRLQASSYAVCHVSAMQKSAAKTTTREMTLNIFMENMMTSWLYETNALAFNGGREVNTERLLFFFYFQIKLGIRFYFPRSIRLLCRQSFRE